MVALFLNRPLEFSAFPTLLLLTTLLRLSLNVAVTRLILSHGNEGPLAAGHVVAAFGGFLMGGDVVIGLIVFAILLVVNFMVITKGSGRIAEVAARFTLDAMPGKQMAIDADLSAGLIDEKEARRRRRELEEESGFFGAMDGAAKFVRGDAIAALIITVINIVGGLAIGVLRHGMAFAEAAATFTMLTVGDGLVSQIPALLVSTAAGIVVTKGGMEGTADVALIRQLGGSPKPLAMAGGRRGGAGAAARPADAAVPGARRPRRRRRVAPLPGTRRSRRPTTPAAAGRRPSSRSATRCGIDMIRLELGYGLLALAGGEAPRLTEQIKGLRRSLAAEMGFVLPPVRIQDNMQLARRPLRRSASRRSRPAAASCARPCCWRWTRTAARRPVPGEPTREPAFGLPALWIDPALKEEAMFRGCTVVDPASVLTTHLTEMVRENMAELLSYAETQKLLDELPREQQKLVADLIPSQITVGRRAARAAGLLAERVSIRDLPTILEGIQEACGGGGARHPDDRRACARAAGAADQRQPYRAGRLHPAGHAVGRVGAAFAEALAGPAEDRQLAMAPSKLQEFMQRLRDAFEPPPAPARRRCC